MVAIQLEKTGLASSTKDRRRSGFLNRSAGQDMASHNFDIVRGPSHRIQVQDQFEMLQGARRINAASLQYEGEMGQVGDKSSGGCCALGSCSRQKKNLSILVRIANQSDNGKRITGGPASSSWDVCRLLIRAWMNIAYEFQFRAFVETKPVV